MKRSGLSRALKTIAKVLFVLAIAGALIYAFLPAPVEVEIVAATRGPLMETVEREGKTRVKERYTITAPLAGQLHRIGLKAGDSIREGQTVLAAIEPTDPTLLDVRSRAEAKAREKAALESVKRAQEDYRQARVELDRARRLYNGRNAMSKEEYEIAEHKERSANYAVRIAIFEYDLAQAALLRSDPARSPGQEPSWRLEVKSPITGSVLEVFEESTKVVTPGERLLRIGDTREIECVIDLLTTNAVKVQPGAKTFLEHWGGDKPILGRVSLIEPGGFTKFSALGVEEQRVNVIVDFVDPKEVWQSLGDGYRVEAKIVTWESDDVLKVPSGALFRQGGDWAVYRVVDGQASLCPVKVGHSDGQESEVLEGLAENDQVITHPSDRIEDGVRVAPHQ